MTDTKLTSENDGHVHDWREGDTSSSVNYHLDGSPPATLHSHIWYRDQDVMASSQNESGDGWHTHYKTQTPSRSNLFKALQRRGAIAEEPPEENQVTRQLRQIQNRINDLEARRCELETEEEHIDKELELLWKYVVLLNDRLR